jgi:hypothetical protein
MTSKIKVDNINKVSDDSNIINKCGSTITLGASGDSIALASGATQTGFGRTGTVDWQTTPKTATFTAVSGEGYFANTSGSAFNMNLPAGVAGAIVSVADYSATFQTNNLTVVPNGSDKIGALNENAILNVQGQSVTLVFVDSTQGWINTMDSTSNVRGQNFITATGGTTSTCGNFKVHTFTGPGTFCISAISATSPVPANNALDYLVVGAGAGGSQSNGGGGGAGGFRLSNATGMPAPLTSPLANPTSLTATVSSIPVTIGAGGGATPGSGGAGCNPATSGSVSTFSTITSAGGGAGGLCVPGVGTAGGSGGGGKAGAAPGTSNPYPGGAGNTPPVSPPQGNTGGGGFDGQLTNNQGGGGGGAGATGSNAAAGVGGDGGAGSYVLNGAGFAGCNGTTGPVTSARYFAGGGGGGTNEHPGCNPNQGTGGAGGGGNAGSPTPERNGGTNTGGGSGAAGGGGSGIVIIRYRFQ